MEIEKLKTNRTIYFDYLRVFATFAVIILHLSARYWYSADVNGFQWQTFNFYDSIVRWCVPIFVMISGSLFLSRDIPLKTIYSKYILRMCTAFLFWSVVYAVFVNAGITGRIAAVITGHYHMWFILMIIGLYMCIPFIKPIVQDEKRTKYFLLLSFIFTFVILEAVAIMRDFGTLTIVRASEALNSVSIGFTMKIVSGYAVYFVLGYFLNKTELSKKQRIIIYMLGLAGFASTVLLNLFSSLKAQEPLGNYYDYFRANVLLEVLAVFTFFKYRKYRFDGLNAFIGRLSKYSFGAFLVHALIIEQVIPRIGLEVYYSSPALGIPILGVIVLCMSFIISAIINHIPFLKKYIV